jgi:hypothetical protein
VEIFPTMGFASAHVTLEALSERHPDWPQLTTWLQETKRLEPLPAGTEEYLGDQHDDAMKRVASALENWQGYSAEEKDRRTLRAADGVGGGDVAVAIPAAEPCPGGPDCAVADARPSAPVVAAPAAVAASAVAAPGAPGVCFPDCRKAYVCSAQGQCISVCNPPCDKGLRCTEDARCVPR